MERNDAPVRTTALEELFLEQLREYWPYLHGDPAFDFFTLDRSDATWWGIDGKRYWKWSASTRTLTWIDR